MNDNTDLIKDFYNVETGTYNACFNGYDLCCLFSVPNPTLKYILNIYDSYSILKQVKNLKHKIIKFSNQFYCDYNIVLICEEKYSCNNNHDHKCDEEHKYKEIYIKINNEEPLSIYKENIISEIRRAGLFNISDFLEISDNSGIITSNGYKYYVSVEVISTLKKYFKCENEKIVCVYNNKKEIAKLTLIAENVLWHRVNYQQSLRLEIGNKKFTFYIDRYKNFVSCGNYCFLIFYIYNNFILGYEFRKDIYYNLSHCEFILKYINQEITNKIKNKGFYTYLSKNNKYYGLCTEFDNNHHRTTRLGTINKVFETILDISLLKPIDEWDDEEINTKKKYYEKEYKDNIENNPNEDIKDNTEK